MQNCMWCDSEYLVGFILEICGNQRFINNDV